MVFNTVLQFQDHTIHEGIKHSRVKHVNLRPNEYQVSSLSYDAASHL